MKTYTLDIGGDTVRAVIGFRADLGVYEASAYPYSGYIARDTSKRGALADLTRSLKSAKALGVIG